MSTRVRSVFAASPPRLQAGEKLIGQVEALKRSDDSLLGEDVEAMTEYLILTEDGCPVLGVRPLTTYACAVLRYWPLPRPAARKRLGTLRRLPGGRARRRSRTGR